MLVTGKVLQFDEHKGYGFVAPDTGGEDVFIHVNDLNFDKRLLMPGTHVEFDLEDGDRGPKASRVNLSHTSTQKAATHSTDDDGLCDVLSPAEFLAEVTESLLDASATLTAEQIKQVRQQLVQLAGQHGWIES